jgi:glycosyltransferase involved in cell wall biosynthesis
MIVGLFPQLTGAGGIQRSGGLTAFAMASFAAQRGEKCHFLTLTDPAGDGSFGTGALQIRFTGCGGSKPRFISAACGLALRQPAIVLALHPNLAPVVSAMKLLAPGMRSAIVVHGVEVWTPLPAIRRWALQSADRILAPSEDTLSRAMREQHIFPGKGRKLAWSLDPGCDPKPQLFANSPLPHGFPEGRVILTVGRWDASEAYKGADHLISAMPVLLKAFSDLHLVAVGEGTDLPRLQSLARESPASERIHFLPFIAHDQLPSAYGHCTIFAMPSRGEGFGLVFIEAMACGKPAIGGDHGGTPDVIDDGVNGYLVRYGDAGQLVDRLTRLLSDDSLRQSMGAQALAKAQRDFTFARFSAQLSAIFAELLD